MTSNAKQFKACVPVDVRYRAFLIGHKGKRINKLREECNNVVIIIPKPDKPDNAVEISGAESDVKKAVFKIKEVCRSLSDGEVTAAVPLPAGEDAAQLLLVAKSPLLRQLSHDYCCKVNVDEGKREVTLVGTAENTEKAKELIRHAVQDSAATGVDTGSGTEVKVAEQSTCENHEDGDAETFKIGKPLAAALCGYNRKLLRFIGTECDKIQITINSSNEVVLSGSEDGVAFAKDQLQKLEKELDSVLSVQTVAAKPQFHKFILGSYGVHSMLQRQKLGVRIVVPGATDAGREMIYIFGRKKDAQDVKRMVEEVAGKLVKFCRQSISVPAEYTNRFTEQRGKVMKQVAADIGCGVHLHLEGEHNSEHLSTRKIVFCGPPLCFQAAEDKISDLVGQYDCFRTQICKIPFELFESVRGPQDAYIRQLMEDYDVKIVFPPPQPVRKKHLMEHVGDVKVSGQVGDVEKACDELMAAVPVCREVRVPLEYYSFFAGHKSSYLDQLKEEFQVVIKVKPAEELHGIIVVIGPEDDVISCCQYIEQQVGLLAQEQNHREKLRFSMSVDVEKCYQKKLIGKKGARLRQLCSRFHIDVTMPPKDDTDDTSVLLQGYEERCRNAADEIQRMMLEMEDRTTAMVDTIPGEFHRKLIGHHGRNIRTISDKFHVDIKVPKSNTEGPIVITGGSQNVEKCADHIRDLATEHKKSVEEDNDEKELMQLYIYDSKKRSPSMSEVFQVDGTNKAEEEITIVSSTSSSGNSSSNTTTSSTSTTSTSSTSSSSPGFVVSNAPWSPKPCGSGADSDGLEDNAAPTWPRHKESRSCR